MKHRKLIMISLSLMLFLLGCQDRPDQSNNHAPTVENEETIADEDDREEINDSTEVDSSEDSEIDDKDKEPLYQVNQSNWVIEPLDEKTDSKVALLTIDDAPDEYALEMAYTLKELEAPAIFFVNGHFIQSEEKQDLLKEIHELGFIIGNHTYNHANLSEISEQEQEAEIVELNDLIEEITGERPKFFRAPFGVNTDYSKEIAAQEGMVLMNWTYGYDWESEYMEPEALADIMINTEYLTEGANLLMHDRAWTAEALTKIVEGLREQGYELVDPSLIDVSDR